MSDLIEDTRIGPRCCRCGHLKGDKLDDGGCSPGWGSPSFKRHWYMDMLTDKEFHDAIKILNKGKVKTAKQS
jgi:hypothetical protein